jgi:hypothetical protein
MKYLCDPKAQISVASKAGTKEHDEHEPTRNIDRLDAAVNLPFARGEEHGRFRLGRRVVGEVIEAGGVGHDVEVAGRVGRDRCGRLGPLRVKEDRGIDSNDRLALDSKVPSARDTVRGVRSRNAKAHRFSPSTIHLPIIVLPHDLPNDRPLGHVIPKLEVSNSLHLGRSVCRLDHQIVLADPSHLADNRIGFGERVCKDKGVGQRRDAGIDFGSRLGAAPG